jgi:hypothetical protein
MQPLQHLVQFCHDLVSKGYVWTKPSNVIIGEDKDEMLY